MFCYGSRPLCIYIFFREFALLLLFVILHETSCQYIRNIADLCVSSALFTFVCYLTLKKETSFF